MASTAPFIYLGPIEIRPATREIVGPAGRDVLEPRVMQVLLVLVRAQGEVVSRDELIRDCWGGRAVSEDAINRAIQRIRRLGRGAAAGGFTIKTIHKIGYRLLQSAASPAEQPAGDNAASRSGGYRRRQLIIGAGTILVSGLAAAKLYKAPSESRVARHLMGQSEQALRLGSPVGDTQAVALLEQAARLSPEDASAWGRLALARTYAAEFAAAGSVSAAATGVQDAARRALDLDERQPDALCALAILPPYFGDWLAAERRMKRVLSIAPNHLPTRDALDFMYTTVGRVREGCGDRVRMAGLAPFHATYQFKLIYAYWLLGRLGEADRAADRAAQLWPRHPGIWWARFNIYALAGRPERAIDLIDDREGRPMLPLRMVEIMRIASIALATENAATRSIAGDKLVQAATESPAAAVMSVTLLAALNLLDQAFDVVAAYLLERGQLIASLRWHQNDVDLRDQRRRNTIMLFVPSSANMRRDPRFSQLVDDVGLTHYWRSAGVRPDYQL